MVELEKPAGMSVWEQQIWAMFATHVERESEFIGSYEQVAADAQSECVRYLVGLILEDEKRHHRQFAELAHAVASSYEAPPVKPHVPNAWPKEDQPGFKETTKRFIAAEREDARELKHLKKALRSVRDTTVWSLLVELMELDTEKHMRILEFLRDQART